MLNCSEKIFLSTLKIIMLFFSALIFTPNLKAQQNIFEKFAESNQNSVIVKNGKMTMENTAHEMSLFVVNKPLDNNLGFKIKSTLNFVSGQQNSGYGIIWNSNGWQNCNVFLISANGYFCIGFYKNGVYISQKKWTKCTFINTGKAKNLLEIEKNGIKTDFFINGNKVFSIKTRKNLGNNQGFAIRKDLKIETDLFDIKTFNSHINTTKDFTFYNKTNAGTNVNSSASEIAPIFSNNTLYFARIHHNKNTGDENDCDIWTAKPNGNKKFQPAENIGSPLNNSGINVVIKECNNGKTLYVEGIYTPDGNFKSDAGISKSTLYNGKQNIPKEIKIKDYYNRNIHATYSFSSDLKVLIMSVERDDSYGDLDLYVSFLQSDGSYSAPQNMGATINTFADDGTPFLANDDKTLFFSSYGHNGYGSSDIFVSYRLDNTWQKWSEPENLGPTVNTQGWDSYFSITDDGSTAYMVSNNPVTASEDIYIIDVEKNITTPEIADIEIKIVNSRTKLPIEAEVFYEEPTVKNSLKSIHNNKFSGSAKIKISQGKKYEIYASADGYLPQTQKLEVAFPTEKTDPKSFTIFLQPLVSGEKIQMKNIFFEQASSNLDPQSNQELDYLVMLMKKYPKLKIEVEGYTDGYGNPEDLMLLSQERAWVVKNYLVLQGIDEKRITTQGYGDKYPINETDRKQNRRVEFKIIDN